MLKEDKRLSLKKAANLATLGMTVERERNKLKKLVEHGISYDAPEILNALQCFQKADAEWKRLEAEYLELRRKYEMP